MNIEELSSDLSGQFLETNAYVTASTFSGIIDWTLHQLKEQGLLMVWRPLETAPTTKGEDSEEFLLLTKNGCVVGFSMGMVYGDDMWVDSREYAEVTPTHWMPMPKEMK